MKEDRRRIIARHSASRRKKNGGKEGKGENQRRKQLQRA